MILGVPPIVFLGLASITPLALLLFAMLPPRRALLATLLVGLLFLPHASIVLPGVPNYTKDLATLSSALLGVVIFDSARLLAFRPRWIDAPIAVFVLAPIATSFANGLGLWDGLSVAFDTFVWAGFPYFLGRLYFTRVEDLRDLLNIAYLNTHGVKISKIAAMSSELRESTVREIGSKGPGPPALINELVMSMLHFDEPRFEGR